MKKVLLNFLILMFSVSMYSFDWPQKEIMSDSFFSYFGEYRGGILSPSLVFSSTEEVKSADKGRVIAVISEHNEETDFFESTLGNSIIIAHPDNLLTVYSNLDGDNNEENFNLKEIEKGTSLGYCGNSAWQEGNSLLEFQVVDTSNKTYINPRILMPRIGNEPIISLKNITLENKKGKSFDINVQKNIPSGIYKIYRDISNSTMIYKSTILINGASVDTITYNTLKENNNKLSTNGKQKYSTNIIYPNKQKQMLGEISLPKGKNRITIVIADILGKEKSLTYSIDAY